MRRLPPLGAIEAFVQVARLGSVKAAAEELALSAPALSRRVQSLERFVAKPLFARRHQAMVLNPDGERLLAEIAPVLDRLSDAVEAMTAGTELLRLRLGVLPLFAAQRLFPHLGELRRTHPELHLDIDTAGHGVARLGEGLDAVWAAAQDYAREMDLGARRQAQAALWFDELLREAAWKAFREGTSAMRLTELRAGVQAGTLTAVQAVTALLATPAAGAR